MAINIEMNYFDGSQYIGLRPLASVDSSSGVLKQVLQYVGTGEDQITQNLSYENPKCLIRLGNYFCFGTFESIAVVNCFYVGGGNNVFVGFVAFEAFDTYVNNDPFIIIRSTSVINNCPKYFQRINIPTGNGNITGQVFTGESNISWFNGNGSTYKFLILY